MFGRRAAMRRVSIIAISIILIHCERNPDSAVVHVRSHGFAYASVSNKRELSNKRLLSEAGCQIEIATILN